MSRRDSAPTFFWVLMSQVNKWLALIFITLIAVFGTVAFAIVNEVHSTCQPSDRNFNVGGYQVNIIVRDGDGMCESQ